MKRQAKPHGDRRAALERDLQRYAAAGAHDRRCVGRMLALLGGSVDPFARTTFDPGHFTASAFVLSPGRDHLLLIWHTRLGRWLQPGGHIDPADASVLAAARRELAEETGLDEVAQASRAGGGGLFDLDIHPIPPSPRRGEPAHEHFDVRLLFVASHARVAAGSDAGAARWVPLAEVPRACDDASLRRAAALLGGCSGPG